MRIGGSFNFPEATRLIFLIHSLDSIWSNMKLANYSTFALVMARFFEAKIKM